ncbi:MAG: selenocysteine-specific translation elongation factor [Ignavibacteriaceae bacterium]
MNDDNQNIKIKKHFIIGTAGHIDHGKTALIKALSGIDCDTHPEEKLRGITINLGFSHLDFSNGTSIGIVDVPGHKDFINTMISGACGIDFVMLVIAADSGVMPQTVEHLHIMQMLGIKSGMVVLTKTDLADEDMLMMIEEDIKELVLGSFLEGCMVLKVSAKTGWGIDDLKNYLSEITLNIIHKNENNLFRMFIDRIFSVAGFGTVITGSVLSGRLGIDDDVFLLPDEKKLRIRRLEKHGKEVNEIIAGNRAAINLSGLKKEEFRRGMVLCNKIITPTSLIDAKIKIISTDKNFNLWAHVIFLSGTFESQAKIHLIDADKLKCGETALAQVHLAQPFIGQIGDRFIIRSSSGDRTIGGGGIIDPYPLHHRRRTDKVIGHLKNIAEGGLAELIAAEVRKYISPVTLDCITNKLNLPANEISKFTPDLLPQDIMHFILEDTIYMMLAEKVNKLKYRIIKTLENYHNNNPLDPDGKNFEELMGIFGLNRNSSTEGVMQCLLTEMEASGIIRKANSTWIMKWHKVSLTEEDRKHIQFVEVFHKNCRMNTPLMSELLPAAYKKGISEIKLKRIIQYLAKKKILFNIDGNYIHKEIVSKCLETLINNMENYNEGITVSQFRDLINGNRKICLLLLTHFDREGITYRDGDLRFLQKTQSELILN